VSDPDLPMPRDLVQGMSEHGSAEQRRWLADLPAVVADLAGRWSLEVGRPFHPGGHTAWVAPGWPRPDAGPPVPPGARRTTWRLKVGWRHPESEHEADGLRLWDGRGAVRLFEAERFGTTSALLMERCLPGRPLGSSRPAPERDLVVARILRTLWLQPPADTPIRPLEQMCDAWAAEFEAALPGQAPPDQASPDQASPDQASPDQASPDQASPDRLGDRPPAPPDRLGDRPPAPPVIDPGLVRDGLAAFRGLPRDSPRRVLLSTDLHAGNVLTARRAPWLVIDPKPWIGDPTYDVLQHLLNEQDRLVADPQGLVDRMADLLDLGRERLRQWTFARCVVESSNWSALAEVAKLLA
jgi:streptomycin 6-kinase